MSSQDCYAYAGLVVSIITKLVFGLQIVDVDTIAAMCPKYSLDKCEEKICWNWLADYAVVDCALSALIFMLFHPHNDFAAPLMG